MNYGLLFTFLVGLFILIGAIIVLKTKANERIVNFSMGIAFSVMIGLIVFDLLPEQYEIFKGQFKTFYLFLLILCCILVGFGILKLLDRFVPDHHEHGKLDEDHMVHIGIVSTIAIVIHNVIEGMALYSSSLISTKTGLMLMVGIGLHNIPMGMIIASSFMGRKELKKTGIISLIVLFFSSFLGGLVLLLFKDISYSVLGILLGITSGMLIYISFMELLPLIRKTKYKKDTILSICIGILLLIVGISL